VEMNETGFVSFPRAGFFTNIVKALVSAARELGS